MATACGARYNEAEELNILGTRQLAEMASNLGYCFDELARSTEGEAEEDYKELSRIYSSIATSRVKRLLSGGSESSLMAALNHAELGDQGSIGHARNHLESLGWRKYFLRKL